MMPSNHNVALTHSRGTAPFPWLWLGLLLVLGVLLRWSLLWNLPMLQFPDSPTYFQAAKDLLSGDFSQGQGRRTPGYPLLLAWAGPQEASILFWQLLAGVGASAALFLAGWRLTGSAQAGFWAGLAHSANFQQLYVESAVLTESFSAFTVAVTVLSLLATLHSARLGRSVWAWCLLTGTLAALAIWVRPQFLYFLPLLPLLVAFAISGWRPQARSLGMAALVAAPMLAALLGWAAVVQSKVGPFTISTQSGFGVLNHLYSELEQAPDEFAVVRDIMIKVRDQRIAQVGNSFNTVWYSWPEVQRVTGWSYAQASANYQRMARAIVVKRPLAYLRSVAAGWRDYWTVPNLWDTEKLGPPERRRVLEDLWWVQHKLLRGTNAVFVLLMAGALVLPRLRRLFDLPLVAVVLVVLVSSVFQAMADYSTNSRYAMPTQSLVGMVLIVLVWRAAKNNQPAHSGGSGLAR